MNCTFFYSFFARMKAVGLVVAVIALAVTADVANAQNAAQYNFSAFAGTYTPVTGGTAVPTIQADDAVFHNVPIGFSFNFCGVPYTQLSVSSNGWIKFGSNTGTVNQLTNSAATLVDVTPGVQPLWDDIDGTGAAASYVTTGSAPSRVFTFEWSNWLWNYLSTTPNISFQVKLYETSGVIDFIYQPLPNAPNTPSATIGIARTTTDYQTLNNTTTAPVPSSTTFTTTISTSPVLGQVYRWSPGIQAPVVTNSGPVCAGSQVTITATSPFSNATFTLVSGPGVTTPVSNTTGIFTVVANVAGTYGVTVDTGNGSSAPGLTTVALTSAPTITLGTVTNPTTCSGTNGSIVIGGLSNNSVFSVYYSRNGDPDTLVSVTTSSTGTITISGLSAGVYTLIRAIGSSVCTSNVLAPVILSDPNAPAAPTVSYNPPLCLGSTLVLTASGAGAGIYTWSGPNNFAPTATGMSVTRSNMTYADTGLYYVNFKVGANGCTSAPGSVRVVITPPPAAPTTTPISFCQGSPATPLTATGQSLKWYLDATGGAALSSAPVPNTTNSGTDTFYVSQTITCEGPRAPLVVTIVPKPGVPDADTVVELCQFAPPIPLTAMGSGLRWYTTATGGIGSAAASIPATTATGIFFFYVSQTVNGCEGDRQQIRVIVKPKPAPPLVLSPVRLCQNDAASPLTAQGQNLLWYTTPGGIGGVPVAPVPFTGYEDTLMYYVSQTVNGCESDRSLINVAVNFKPNVSIQASRDYACVGDTISFNYYGNGRVTSDYIWSITGPGSIVSGQGTQGPLALRYDKPGFYTVSLVVDNAGCISRTETQTFEIRGIPRFAINAPDAGCQGQPITISATEATQGIDSYSWDFGEGVANSGSFNGGPYSVTFQQPGDKVVSVVVSTRECGAQRVYDTLRVEAAPFVDIRVVDNGTVCAGDTIRLVANYDPSYTYYWTPDVFVDGARTSTVDARISSSGFVKLETVTGLGCRDVDSVFLNVKSCCDAKLPTAFSPNGDGLNDNFRIITPGFNELSSFRVTNRWGRTVWETGNHMTGVSTGWNGMINNVPAENGVYYWYLKYTCTDGLIYEKSGEVTLIH